MPAQWFWCLRHSRVEPFEGCSVLYRMGPYRSRGEAELALERARARTEAWDADDERWKGAVPARRARSGT